MTEVLTGMNFDTGSGGEGAVVLDKQTYSNPIDSYWMAKKAVQDYNDKKALRIKAQREVADKIIADQNINIDDAFATDIPYLADRKKQYTNSVREYTMKNGINSDYRQALKPLRDEIEMEALGSKVQNKHYAAELAKFDALMKEDNNIDIEATRKNFENYNRLNNAERIKIGTPPLIVTKNDSDVNLFLKARKANELNKGVDVIEEKGGKLIKSNQFGDQEWNRTFGALRANPDFEKKAKDSYIRFAQLNPAVAERIENDSAVKYGGELKPYEIYFKESNPNLGWFNKTDIGETTALKESLKSKYDLKTERGKAKIANSPVAENWQNLTSGKSYESEYIEKDGSYRPLEVALKPFPVGDMINEAGEVQVDNNGKPKQVTVIGREIVRDVDGTTSYKLKLDAKPSSNLGNVTQENGIYYLNTNNDKLAFDDIWSTLTPAQKQIVMQHQGQYDDKRDYYKESILKSTNKGVKGSVYKPMVAKQKSKTESKKPKLDY